MAGRRGVLIALGAAAISAAVSWPAPAGAQERKALPRIGVLFANTATVHKPGLIAFTEGLREFGLVDGKTIVVLLRYGDGSTERLQAHAVQLAHEKVDVIVASSGRAVEVSVRASPGTPIVCIDCGDLVGSGYAASLARPGGSVTGTTIMSPELNYKRIQLLMEITPKLRRMAVVTSPEISRTNAAQVVEVEQVAKKLGLETQVFMNRGAGSFDQLAEQLQTWRAESVLLMSTPTNGLYMKDLVDISIRLKVPHVAGGRSYADVGALAGYGPAPGNSRRAAYFVDRILKGAKPGDLPIEQPTKFELAINMKTAKSLKLTIPQSILVGADRVID